MGRSPARPAWATRAILTLGFLLTACAPIHPAGESMTVGGGAIDIQISREIATPHWEIREWVRRAATAVSGYLGHFPTRHLVIILLDDGREPIGEGQTFGNSRIEARLSQGVQVWNFEHDWILTHEMFHLAFPTLDRRYLWMMEGLSDYLEPVARVRAGQITTEEFWRELVEGLPQGLPGPGDEGLDNTHTWGRTYWGGDLFWLLADVNIRVQTGNRHSVGDAIRAIVAAGGTGDKSWPIERVLDLGDKATGTTVLKELHEEMGPKATDTNLTALWKKLGVKYNLGRVTFDDAAPWASVRRAITAASSPPAKTP